MITRSASGLILFGVFVLGACSTSKQLTLADGTTGHAVRCGGTLTDWTGCLEKAGAICGTRGYDTIDRRSETTWDTTTRMMVVRCK